MPRVLSALWLAWAWPLAVLAQTQGNGYQPGAQPGGRYQPGGYGGGWAWGWLWVIAAVVVLAFIIFGIFGSRRRTPPPSARR